MLASFQPAGTRETMISNERSYSPRTPSNEETLRTESIQVERKSFLLSLKENPRGRFLRISEDVGGRRNSIIIPAPGLEEFQKVLAEMVRSANETPPKLNDISSTEPPASH